MEEKGGRDNLHEKGQKGRVCDPTELRFVDGRGAFFIYFFSIFFSDFFSVLCGDQGLLLASLTGRKCSCHLDPALACCCLQCFSLVLSPRLRHSDRIGRPDHCLKQLTTTAPPQPLHTPPCEPMAICPVSISLPQSWCS